jgi:hypothetical protein
VAELLNSSVVQALPQVDGRHFDICELANSAPFHDATNNPESSLSETMRLRNMGEINFQPIIYSRVQNAPFSFENISDLDGVVDGPICDELVCKS